MLLRVNPIIVFEKFKEHVSPYKEHIVECNENFLLNKLQSELSIDGEPMFDFKMMWKESGKCLKTKA